MITALGLAVFGGSVGALWAVLPNRQFHAWTRMPVLETLIPLAIVSGLAIGLAMILSILG